MAAAAVPEEAYRWRVATYPHPMRATWAVTCVYKAAAAADVAAACRCVLARMLPALSWLGVAAVLPGAAVPCMSGAARLLVLATREQQA